LTGLAIREFSIDDQMRFAHWSQDFNPMHTDALQARRTQAGEPVVHGIHLLLWALDALSAEHPNLPKTCRFRVKFGKFVPLDEPVSAELVHIGPEGVLIKICVSGAQRSSIKIEFESMTGEAIDLPAPLDRLDTFSHKPTTLSFEELDGRSGYVPFPVNHDQAEELFPATAQWLGTRRIAALAASTRLVGMVCPGLHSIYAELSFSTCPDSVPDELLSFQVNQTDPRFRLAFMDIGGGGLTGTVKSIARTPPVEQATMQSLSRQIGPSEFSGSIALIIGGSRGLGELTAKMIASGGGHVIITWRSGKDDAEKVAQEIRAAGGKCETVPYDVYKPVREQLSCLTESPTHAYYFATPAIFRPQAGTFVPSRLEDFLSVYVNGFWELSQALRERSPQLSLFYPSSVSVADRPAGMTEYSMAKAAGEILCADMNKTMAPMRVTTSRLPRLPTDQTATIRTVETACPVETMLPLVREVQSWPKVAQKIN
jgi:acyl dehydratase